MKTPKREERTDMEKQTNFEAARDALLDMDRLEQQVKADRARLIDQFNENTETGSLRLRELTRSTAMANDHQIFEIYLNVDEAAEPYLDAREYRAARKDLALHPTLYILLEDMVADLPHPYKLSWNNSGQVFFLTPQYERWA